MNYSYISNVLSFYCNSLCFLTQYPHLVPASLDISPLWFSTFSFLCPPLSSPPLNLIDSFTFWFWFHLLSWTFCFSFSHLPLFFSHFLSHQLFLPFSTSSPLLTGILETDITFLVIFSMVFLLSCYFACKYRLFHSLYLAFFPFFYEQANLFWLSEPAEVIKCPFPLIYYKIYMFSWWDRSKSSCLLW